MMLAAVKNPWPSSGIPVANMWWTHRPNPMNPVDTSASTIARYPTMRRRENVAMIIDTMPVAGMKMM